MTDDIKDYRNVSIREVFIEQGWPHDTSDSIELAGHLAWAGVSIDQKMQQILVCEDGVVEDMTYPVPSEGWHATWDFTGRQMRILGYMLTRRMDHQ